MTHQMQSVASSPKSSLAHYFCIWTWIFATRGALSLVCVESASCASFSFFHEYKKYTHNCALFHRYDDLHIAHTARNKTHTHSHEHGSPARLLPPKIHFASIPRARRPLPCPVLTRKVNGVHDAHAPHIQVAEYDISRHVRTSTARAAQSGALAERESVKTAARSDSTGDAARTPTWCDDALATATVSIPRDRRFCDAFRPRTDDSG